MFFIRSSAFLLHIMTPVFWKLANMIDIYWVVSTIVLDCRGKGWKKTRSRCILLKQMINNQLSIRNAYIHMQRMHEKHFNRKQNCCHVRGHSEINYTHIYFWGNNSFKNKTYFSFESTSYQTMETLHLLWITSNKMFGSYIKVSNKQALGMRMYSCIQSTSDPSRCNPDILTSESDWKLEFCSFQLAIVVCHTKTQGVNNEKFRRRLFSKYKLYPKEFI